ncbi:MAG: hypothetical protein IJJ33_13130, partial [Victivallales bacterium]|nr:hypothetical protein [Victivallales bacterium]
MRNHFGLFLLTISLSAVASFELFDKSPVQGILREGAALLSSGGQDGSGALQISGAGKSAQYGYAYRWEKVEPEQQYGISFAYRPSDNFQGSAMVVVNFAKDDWKFDQSKVFRRAIPI